MLSVSFLLATPTESSFLATCSARSRRPACLAERRPRSRLRSSGGGVPPRRPRLPPPSTLPPPLEPFGSSMPFFLSWPPSYFSPPSPAGRLRPFQPPPRAPPHLPARCPPPP